MKCWCTELRLSGHDTGVFEGFESAEARSGAGFPKEILAAAKSKLVKLLRWAASSRSARRSIERGGPQVKAEFGGDLKSALQNSMRQEKKQTDKGIRGAKKVLQQFPVIGEPSAEKILLFSKLAAVAAVPSANVEVPARLWFGKAGKNYAAGLPRGARNPEHRAGANV